MKRIVVGSAVIVGCLVVACSGTSSGTSGGGAGSCSNDFSGKWSISGSCQESSCTVTQSSSCTLDIACTKGTKLSGSINGTSLSLSGSAPDGTNLSCSGSATGTKIELSCSTAQGNCSVNGSCTSGSCGKAISSSSSSSGDGPSPPGSSTGTGSSTSGSPPPTPTGSGTGGGGGQKPPFEAVPSP